MSDSMDIDSQSILLPIQTNLTGLAETSRLAQSIVRQDLTTITEECWEILQFSIDIGKFWPADGFNTSKDSAVTNSIQYLDSIITSTAISNWKKRIAYMCLAELFVCLEQPVRSDRKRKRLEAKRGSKVAGSIYSVFQQAVQRQVSDKEIRRNIRIGKRYQTLLQGSSLLAIAYCNNVDKIIRDFSITPKRLEDLAKTATETNLASISKASPNFQQLIARAISEQYNGKQMKDALVRFFAEASQIQ
ncbi:hypothetical protein F5Y16DRAFT_406092 [Xylariaceae sp. FL0255]|nr:hypothetical protein F5Y16DRAFT_406092 [Xylariaceae sp. FL0255]